MKLGMYLSALLNWSEVNGKIPIGTRNGTNILYMAHFILKEGKISKAKGKNIYILSRDGMMDLYLLVVIYEYGILTVLL